MKKLLLLRHAQALGTEIGGSDKTRKLSPKGIEDARALGKLMARDGLQPDIVLCSAATRTRETLAAVMEALDETAIDYLDRLYNAEFEILLDAIHTVNDTADTVLLVAHNPGIHSLAAQLAADDGAANVDRLLMSYAPATLSVLECDVEHWADIKPYEHKLRALHETSEYNADDRPTRWM